MPVSEYPFVLTERLGEDGCTALVDMADDRDGGLAREVSLQFGALEHRMDQRFAAIDTRFAAIDTRFAVFEERVERRLAVELGGLRLELSGIRTEVVQQRADLMKWAMVFWISQAAAVAGIVSVLR